MSDELLQRLRRELKQAPGDQVLRDRYVTELERVVDARPIKHPRAELTANEMPCLLCEKLVSFGDYEKEHGATLAEIIACCFDQGAHCRHGWSSGNYGCQVLDSGGTMHFVICDGCLIRHSPKMLFQSREPVVGPDGKYEFVDFHDGGSDVKYENGPLENARDHYEKWHERLKTKYWPNDTYMKDVAPHFED